MPSWDVVQTERYQRCSGNNSYMVPMTAGATNVKGAWTVLTSATVFPVHGMNLFFGVSSGASSCRGFVDVAAGVAGAEQVLVANIPFGGPAANSDLPGGSMFFPISVSAGVPISARMQATVASRVLGVSALLAGGGYAGSPGFSRAETYGVNVSSSNGTVLDPGGSDVEVITQITAATVAPIRWLVPAFTTGVNGSPSMGYFIARVMVGAVNSEVPILPGIFLRTSFNITTGVRDAASGYYVSIPAGSRVSVGLTCSNSDATDRVLECTLIGFS